MSGKALYSAQPAAVMAMEEDNNTHQSISFEGYDQTKKIGQGGMATVWKARQISLDRWVAIKVLSPEQCSDEEEIDRFQSEARTVAKMNHSGIVQVYDAFYRNDHFCFVMDFVDGYTVGAWLKNRGYLAQEECLFVATGVAEALLYAWSKHKLIHCDIKPDNIMIDIDGSVKITDFGLSTSLSSLQARKPLSDGAYVFGTPAYIAPEQATGEQHLTIHADMYALGASLYHMSTGTRLFAEINAEEVMDMQVNAQYKDPYELNTTLSPFFCDFIERLLCKNRNDRYSSWEEILEEIENIKKGLPLIYGEINPTKARSTVLRSKLRDAARNDLLRSLNIHQRSFKPTADPVSSLEHRYKFSLKNFAQHDYSKSLRAAKSLFRIWWDKVITFSKVIKTNRHYRTGLKCLAGLLVLTSAVCLASHFGQREKSRVLAAAKMELAEIDDTFRINPTAYRTAIEHCNTLISDLEGPAYASLRQQVINKRKLFEDARENNVEKVMNDLRVEIQPLLEERNFLGAAEIVYSFDGEMADETFQERMQMADALHEQVALDSQTNSASENE